MEELLSTGARSAVKGLILKGLRHLNILNKLRKSKSLEKKDWREACT